MRNFCLRTKTRNFPPTTKRKMEINKIYQGECLEVMKRISDTSIDMILCDLPYGTTACLWDAIIPFKELWNSYYRIIRPNGFIILTASQPFTTKLINSNIDNFSHQWIWEKEQGANPLLANVQPMKNFEDVIVFSNEHRFDFCRNNPLREYALKIKKFIKYSRIRLYKELGNYGVQHFLEGDNSNSQFNLCTRKAYAKLIEIYNLNKEGWFISYEEMEIINSDFLNKYPRVYNPQKVKGSKYTSGAGYFKHLANDFKGGNVSSERYPTSIITFNTDKNKNKHPTQKPLALFEYLIKTYTNENDLILDNCIGSGTTAVACKRTNRNFIGIEKEQKYVDIANKRLQQETLNYDGGKFRPPKRDD